MRCFVANSIAAAWVVVAFIDHAFGSGRNHGRDRLVVEAEKDKK
jgi:hypothetical protein